LRRSLFYIGMNVPNVNTIMEQSFHNQKFLNWDDNLQRSA